jgi:hypothetical protein
MYLVAISISLSKTFQQGIEHELLGKITENDLIVRIL